MPQIYHTIEVPRTAHYLVAGPPANQAHTTTIACHGYGQLATYMQRKCQSLVERGHRIVSVEGLNTFYWEGTEGKPVANWMTSHHRQDEINDFCQLLSAVYDVTCAGAQRIIVLGFSQGATTIWRWLHRHQPEIDAFVNVAGWIPEDIDLSVLQPIYPRQDFYHLYSETDQYLTPERKATVASIAKRSGLGIEFIRYEGGHRVVPQSLIPLYRQWE